MQVKSLSIIVPEEPCINNCAYCIYEMQGERNGNCLDGSMPGYILSKKDYATRLAFAREDGCNALVLTGQCEPQQHRAFLTDIGNINNNLANPFPIVDMQTTGVLLDKEYLYFLRVAVGVNIITLQVASFLDPVNQVMIGMMQENKLELEPLCRQIRKSGFMLRLAIHLTDYFNVYQGVPEQLFKDAKEKFGAQQITLRILSKDGDSIQADWVREHSASEIVIDELKDYIGNKGIQLEQLEYGMHRYSIMGMSVIIDSKRMPGALYGRPERPVMRADGRLYSRWDDEGSIIF